MKRKNFFIKFAGIAFLILVLVGYFLVYFLPSVKAINRYKRTLKDMNLKISDFLEMERAFSFSNQVERLYFSRSEQELKIRFPEVRSREEFVALFTKVSDYVRNLAVKDGISNLVLTFGSSEVSDKDGLLSTDKKSLDDLIRFSAQCLDLIRKKMEMEQQNRNFPKPRATPRTDGGLASLVKGVKHHTAWLSFTGNSKNAASFINHIPWGDSYLRTDKIVVVDGNLFPYYILLLKIYYIDLRSGPEAGKRSRAQPQPQPVSSPSPSEGSQTIVDDGGPVIDFNSEILLKRIPAEMIEKVPDRELPDAFGRPIFSTGLEQVEKQRVETGTAGEVEYRLNAVIIDRRRRIAIINDTILKKGDIIAGARVTAVMKSKVVLKVNGKDIELSTDSPIKRVRLTAAKDESN
jgi:hypothetical protein